MLASLLAPVSGTGNSCCCSFLLSKPVVSSGSIATSWSRFVTLTTSFSICHVGAGGGDCLPSSAALSCDRYPDWGSIKDSGALSCDRYPDWGSTKDSGALSCDRYPDFAFVLFSFSEVLSTSNLGVVFSVETFLVFPVV